MTSSLVVHHPNKLWNANKTLLIIIIRLRLCLESANLRQNVKPQPKVIRDSNLDFRINPDSDPNVCRIGSKMLRIHYLVRISYFAECSENHHHHRPVTVREMLINIKSSILHWWGKWKTDQESVFGTRSPPKVNQFVRLVGPMITTNLNEMADYFCSNPAHLQIERMTEWQTDCTDCITPLADVITSNKPGASHIKPCAVSYCRVLSPGELNWMIP